MSDNEHLDDIQSFPVLTSEVGARGSRRVGAADGVLGATVEQTLYEILGWRPRTSDHRGFVAALTQSFASVPEAEGGGWKWTPHTYTIQADLGAVTGAQASIYKQAMVIRKEALPLLDGLDPLRADADEEDIDAGRAIVESSIIELVSELGFVGGPRVQRVDTLFQILLGIGPDAPTPDEPEQVEGQLGSLRESFGLERDRVNTIEEENNLTNYLVLVDYVLSLRRTWRAQRHFFDRTGSDVYLGTHLVLISRALATLVESVYEAYDAMDSVFLGEVERQTIDLDLEGETTKITIAELLAWAERFGSEEGPRLIREGGKEGVRAFLPTIDRLRGLLRRAWELSQNPQNAVRGFHTPRVQRTFEELTLYSDRIYQLTVEVVGSSPPQLDLVIPSSGFQETANILVTVIGEDFQPDAALDFGQGITVVEGPTFHSEQTLTARIDIAAFAAPGFRDVTVTNPDNQWQTKVNGFLVLLPPDEDEPEPGDEEPPDEEEPGPVVCGEIDPKETTLASWDGEMVVTGQNLDTVKYVDLVHRIFVPAYMIAMSHGLAEEEDLDIDRVLDRVFLAMRSARPSLSEALGLWRRLVRKTTMAMRGHVIGERSEETIAITFDPPRAELMPGPWAVILVDEDARVTMCREAFEVQLRGPTRRGRTKTKADANG